MLPRGGRRFILALVLLFAVMAGPARPIRSVLGPFDHSLGFLPAFSAEPTVSVQLARPAPGAWVGRFVTVEATVLADQGISSIKCIAAGSTVDELAPSTPPTAWHYTFIWDSVATPEGSSTVTLVACDPAGRTSTATAEVRIDHSIPLVAYTPQPSQFAFSPNRDHKRDTLDVTIKSSEPVTMRVDVGSGAAMRRLLTVDVPRYTAKFTWDGRLYGASGLAAVRDGTYPLTVAVQDRAGNAAGGRLTAVVDRAAPLARWVSLSPGAFYPAKNQRAKATVSASDASGGFALGVNVVNAANQVVRKLSAGSVAAGDVTSALTGARSVAWDGRYAARGKIVPPGTFRLVPTVTDIAGNQVVLAARRVRVHSMRPPTTIFRVSTKQKLVALTFDDLYGLSQTRSILATLKTNGIKATFFGLGQAARAHPQLMREIVAQGHILGNHTYSHPQLNKISAAAVRSELVSGESTLRGYTGLTTSPLMRPPYGSSSRSVAAICASLEFPYVIQWDVDTRDWASPGVGRIVATVGHETHAGSIILMHGGPSQTPVALPLIINMLKARGYKMVTIPELLWAGGYR